LKSLLLLHGALGASSQFAELESFLNRSFEVHTLNFTGHGGEEIPDEAFSIEMFAGDIIRFMYESGIERTNIFGYSMGGFAGLYAAKLFPDKFDKIFTLATKFEWSPEIASREVKMLDAAAIRAKVPDFAEQLIQRHGEDNWGKVLAKTAAMMTSLGRENTLRADDYSDIESEVTVAVGDRDKMVTLEETIAVYRKLKNAELLVLPGTAHQFEGVEASVLAAEIIRFMQEPQS
jgi:pimeloyl-ACP methyl ester carboxylesterase